MVQSLGRNGVLEKDEPAALSMAETAYQSIRRLILQSELPPGHVVSERQLAEHLGVGKATVRVAAQRLASDGLVSIEHRRGIVIKAPSLHDFLDLYQIRRLIEPSVARDLAGRLNAERIDALKANQAQMRAAAEAGDVGETVTVDFALHRLLFDYFGNEHLSRLIERVLDSLYREVWTTLVRCSPLMESSCRMHDKFIEAIIDGDEALAEREMLNHLTVGEQRILTYRQGGATDRGRMQ